MLKKSVFFMFCTASYLSPNAQATPVRSEIVKAAMYSAMGAANDMNILEDLKVETTSLEDLNRKVGELNKLKTPWMTTYNETVQQRLGNSLSNDEQMEVQSYADMAWKNTYDLRSMAYTRNYYINCPDSESDDEMSDDSHKD